MHLDSGDVVAPSGASTQVDPPRSLQPGNWPVAIKPPPTDCYSTPSRWLYPPVRTLRFRSTNSSEACLPFYFSTFYLSAQTRTSMLRAPRAVLASMQPLPFVHGGKRTCYATVGYGFDESLDGPGRITSDTASHLPLICWKPTICG